MATPRIIFSMEPKGTRSGLPIPEMRLRPLPAPSPDESRRMSALFRKRPLPRRGAR